MVYRNFYYQIYRFIQVSHLINQSTCKIYGDWHNGSTKGFPNILYNVRVELDDRLITQVKYRIDDLIKHLTNPGNKKGDVLTNSN